MKRIGAMVGSPGDAIQERQAITDTILRWNAVNGADRETFLEPVKWETHATPGLDGRPQGMINEELIPISDFLIAVFRVRAGSPTGKEISGTIEEIQEFMSLGKYVVAYFYEGETSVKGLDLDQLKKVQDFKKEIQQHGLVETYATVSELQAKLAIHLSAIVKRLESRLSSLSTTDVSVQTTSPTTSVPKRQKPTPSRERRQTKANGHSGGGRTRNVISDSGRWMLLHTRFIEARAVRQNKDQMMTIELVSKTADDDAAISALRPHHFGRAKPIPFAHGNDAWLVTVKEIEAFSQGKGQVWTLTLVPEKVEYGGNIMDGSLSMGGKHYSADDFARMRAGRILLNNPPPIKEQTRPGSNQAFMEEAFLETHIQGMHAPVSVTHCVLQAVYKEYIGQPSLFLKLSRLAAIYFLKAGGVVELVQEMTLGPITKGKVHVRFRGIRRRMASNVEPTTIELEGDCPLK